MARAVVIAGSSAEARAPRMGKTLQFMQGLWALAHALDAKSKRMHRELGITGPQRLALRVIGRDPGIAAGDLAAHLRVHPSTLTGVLARLLERGLITRRSDPGDARRVLVSLTRRGRALDEEHAGTVEAALRRALARLDPQVVESGRQLLATIVEELENEEPPRAR